MAALLQDKTSEFWRWFAGFTTRLRRGDLSEQMLDELLDRLHRLDERLYVELCTNATPHELILTAQGRKEAFPIVEAIARSAPDKLNWTITPLKPPRGFAFTLRQNDFAFEASELWFLPLYDPSAPNALGLRIGIPEMDRLFRKQEIDVAYTILETGLGERSCAEDIQYVEVDDLPPDPRSEGYRPLPELSDFIAQRKSSRRTAERDRASRPRSRPSKRAR